MGDPPATRDHAAGRALSGAQRRWLRGRAHELRPVVQVGDAGVTGAVLEALDRALADHELVKVRLRAPDDKRGAARELAERSGAELCGLVGHTVVLYRRDPERPQLALPER